MPRSSERKLIARQAIAPTERKRHAEQADRSCENDRDGEREHRANGRKDAVASQRCHREDSELPRSQPEGKTVLHLNVGGQAYALLAHISPPIAPRTTRKITYVFAMRAVGEP